MFTKTISSPVSPLTYNYFANHIPAMVRPNNEPDWSLSCLGVALIRPRVEKYCGITGCVDGLTCATSVEFAITRRNSRRQNESSKTIPGFHYMYMSLNEENLSEIKKAMNAQGFEELKAVEAFVAQQLKMTLFAVYIDKETNSAFIWAPSSNMALYHLCLGFISALFPNIFKDKPLSIEEIQLVKSLTNKTHDRFVATCSNLLKPLKQQIVKEELTNCFRGFRSGKIRAAEQDVERIRYSAEEALKNYRNIIDNLNTAIINLEGLKVVNSDENNTQEQEAIDYIVSEPRIHNVQYSNGQLTFDVTTVLTNTDVMKFKNQIRRGDVFNGYHLADDNPFKNLESRKLLLNALFGTESPELNVKVRGKIVLQITRNFMDAPRGENFDESNPAIANCLTNPHFKLHGCPGQNRTQIIECLQQADIETAIEASISATGSVNIDETDITFRPFVQEILTSDKKIIRRCDGVEMTTAEALLWLTKKELAA